MPAVKTAEVLKQMWAELTEPITITVRAIVSYLQCASLTRVCLEGGKLEGKTKGNADFCFSFLANKKTRERERSTEREGNVRATFRKCHTVKKSKESSTFILSFCRKGKTEGDDNCRHSQC